MRVIITLAFLANLACVYSMSIQDLQPRHELNAVEKLIELQGYPSETHSVITEDGYVLTMHRIPRSAKTGPPTKGVVFLQHGLLSCAADWVVMGQKKGLGFMLSDAGYDVWMGNARGNTFSKRHTKLDPVKNAAKFWAFSWHEIGYYDLPAMIDYVLKVTGEKKLSYSGHSQGTTAFFVMTSERPEYNAKVKSMQALAPVAYMSHITSPFLRALTPFIGMTEALTKLIGMYEFLPSNKFLSDMSSNICRDNTWTQDICTNVLFLLCGFNPDQLNTTALPAVIQNTPAGSSSRQLLHYGQLAASARFRQYDLGWLGNIQKYGHGTPPEYDLSKVTVPVGLHYGENDWMANPLDVDILSKQLRSVIGKFRVNDAKWNHLDFTYGIDAHKMLYPKVISMMNRYS